MERLGCQLVPNEEKQREMRENRKDRERERGLPGGKRSRRPSIRWGRRKRERREENERKHAVPCISLGVNGRGQRNSTRGESEGWLGEAAA